MPATTLDRTLDHAHQLMEAGDPASAVAALRPIVAKAPGLARARYLLGRALMYQGFLDDAAGELETAATFSPKDPGIWISLGVARQQQDDRPRAIDAFRRALDTTSPGDSATLMRLGETFADLGDPGSSRRAFEAAISAAPDRPEPLGALTQLTLREGRTREAARLAKRTAELARENPYPLFLTASPLNYAGDTTPQEIRDAHARFGRAAEGLAGPVRPHANTPDPERRLKIGFVSGDFCQHSVVYYIEPVIELLDRAKFEVFLYSNTRREDSVTERLAALDVHWRGVAFATDQQFAEQVRTDGVDILFDLSGHTTGARLQTFAMKPAPIQATYLGYPNTTGLSRVDYRLVDAVTDPLDTPPVCSEALERLPRCFLCYRPDPAAPPVSPAPCTLSPDAPFTFGSFNNLAKFDDITVELWARALGAVPGSRLVLKSGGLDLPAVRDALLARFQTAGLDPARIEILPRAAGTAEHLALYSKVDLGLDTFPYHGTTTTCEAFWQGVPVLCLTGWSHASRVGASLNSAIGLDRFTADTPERFVEIARAAAGDRSGLGALRAGMRDRLRASPLMDEEAFCRTFEAALRGWWTRWCAARR
jgi:protein O-GlcNAc transferase